MTRVPITVITGDKKTIGSIQTDEKIDISKINTDNDYKIYYSNDLALFNMVIKKNTNFSMNILESISDIELKTLQDYKDSIQSYIITFSRMILKKIQIDWNEFKNFITCQIPFENSFIDVEIIAKEEFKPDEKYETAKKKFVNIHNNQPTETWNNTMVEITSLNLNFVGNM